MYVVPDAEGHVDSPQVFATLDDDLAAGVAFAPFRSEVFVATTNHVWAIAYHGEAKARNVLRIANVRTGSIVPGTDGDIHTTTSVAYAGGRLYVAAGSSCNATVDGGKSPCTEVDPTRAAVSVMNPDGSGLTQRAKRIRNAIALTVNQETGSLWSAMPGKTTFPSGTLTSFSTIFRRIPATPIMAGPNVRRTGTPMVWVRLLRDRRARRQLPAYSTIVGATFYPQHQNGVRLPGGYHGGLFAAVHGSWHRDAGGCLAAAPRVVFVPMDGDRPVKPVDWQNPNAQWTDFFLAFRAAAELGSAARPASP